MEPASIFLIPATVSTSDVLPAPFGPMMVSHVPASTLSVTSFISVFAPAFTVRFLMSMALIAGSFED